MASPIFYVATSRAVAEQRVPQVLLRQLSIALVCAGCEVPVVAVKRDLVKSINLSQQTERKLVILCERCSVRELANLGDLIGLHFFDREIQSQLMRQHLENN